MLDDEAKALSVMLFPVPPAAASFVLSKFCAGESDGTDVASRVL
jgi:hypothetical protein